MVLPRLRLLFVAPYLPSPVRVRPYHLALRLAARHELTVLALTDGSGGEDDALVELVRAGARVETVPLDRRSAALRCLLALPTREPLWSAFCRSRMFARRLQSLCEEQAFDLAHIEHLRAAHAREHLPEGLPTVFDGVDCLTALFRQMAARRFFLSPGGLLAREEAAKLTRFEPRAAAGFDRVVLTAERERDALLALDPALPVRVIPNGVDTDYFAATPLPAGRPPTIVFSGKMSYFPNADAARFFASEVFPVVRDYLPAARLVLAGSSPPPAVRRLGELPGIEVTGHVPDLRPSLARATIAVCPMRVAVGVQNKALEAMATGRAVVASPAVLEAFGERRDGLLPADSAGEWAETVVALLGDPDRAAAIGREARRHVEERFSWDRSVELLEEVYAEAIAARRGGRREAAA